MRAQLDAVAGDVVAWRRHLHRHPEPSFEEHETAAFVAEQLVRLGLSPQRPTPTSVVATIRGGRPGGVVALRADLDALPLEEATGLAFASLRPGLMHACGHDGHTAALLGAAQVLQARRARLPGELRLIFQHGEERPPQGARELVAAGVLAGVEAIFGLHLWAPLGSGLVGLPYGAAMASADTFAVELRGRGGHAGLPHDARNPIAAAADLVQALARVVAAETAPGAPAVATVTTIDAGDATNVIPERARVGGTLRALDAATRRQLLERLDAVATAIATSHRIAAEVTVAAGPDPVVNDDRLTGVVERACDAAALPVVPFAPLLASDDFGCYQSRVPGVYAFVGAGAADGSSFPHHHPRFDLDERALATATELHVRAAEALAAAVARRPVEQ